MLYTFYSVARREHIVGLWRGLVPVSKALFFHVKFFITPFQMFILTYVFSIFL